MIDDMSQSAGLPLRMTVFKYVGVTAREERPVLVNQRFEIYTALYN